MGTNDTFINAFGGAIVTLVLSFTVFSPILGGAVAGYLQFETPTKGAKVGALSGGLSFVPFLFFGFLFLGIFLSGPMVRGQMMRNPVDFPGGPELLFFVIPAFFLWNVGLGAIGGYLAVHLRDEYVTTEETQESL